MCKVNPSSHNTRRITNIAQSIGKPPLSIANA
jgi:hypothetical protein